MAEPLSVAAPLSQRAAILARAAPFETLAAEDLEALAGLAKVTAYREGDFIFRKGDQSRVLYVVDRGRVKIAAGAADGRETVLNLLGAGAVFGEIALIDGGERTADAITLEATTLLALDRRDLLPFLETRPGLTLRMLAAVTARLRWVSARYEDAVFLDLPTRLARRLLFLGEHFGLKTARGLRLTVALPQRELAAHMNVTRETVNRLLTDWFARGLIERDKDVLILKDMDALNDIAHPSGP